ncbi:similarity to GAL4 DNA-BINDING ENHANCER PROTEIN [Encephalitozoon cuniculi GB-M1]|uniref:Nascent polypeptide-associated complex subunit alpha n=2 Tax=Encephalitozoon cuniculi TaxID=6035 RepID=NACA_ENCCU|nr:nascent polypeptide-associated complex domain-containing protein [Encephalitozoon cuniculi GB-M1]Q8SWB5.1 RecName: Full=Nascent polypeptide-associated complex subunit alpha; Short=NAC-alpha; AltName: Full=Alpha-NAC [Encephalitozoon cuniculi GB-M1]AGE95617.1 gal4 DNA-binding enhancer protein [Encephalitozoon cuniculi]KMV66623.1 nascent polypeptide-associated complexdomain-containing protein [Encephalitozoon cuniculi EcunIII-L]UYI28298.1 nascent polypeptide-associated complex subunit [Encephal
MARALTTDESHIHKTLGAKVGLEEVEAVERIAIVVKDTRYSVESPVAYRIKGTDSILIFGDLGSPVNLHQLKRMYEDSIRSSKDQEGPGLYDEIHSDPQEDGVKEAEEITVDPSDERLSEEDIKLISSQVKASRNDIIKALVESEYDVVDAMMKLTK